jgi:hypothetical protein
LSYRPRRQWLFRFQSDCHQGFDNMKKIIASLVTTGFALVSAQAFAQASAAEAASAAAPAAASAAKPAAASAAKASAASAAKPNHAREHKHLQHHGKHAATEEAASAAGTDDKGAPH